MSRVGRVGRVSESDFQLPESPVNKQLQAETKIDDVCDDNGEGGRQV